MAKKPGPLPERERVLRDQREVDYASKNVYDKWAERFDVEMLEKYRLGEQWQGESEDWSQKKYVINLFSSSINISKPSLLFQLPKYKVTPRITRIDDPKSDVEARAKLQEDTLNTFVQDPKLGFAVEADLCVLDSQSRFAVMQVGYTNDFIDNPNAGKPILTDELDENGNRIPMMGSDGEPAVEANVITEGRSEQLFVKWISASCFRVSARNGNRFEDCDWVGYYEWHYAEDLKKNPRYRNTANLKPTGRLKDDKATSDYEDQSHAGMLKVWFKWDLRSKTRRIFAEGQEKFLLEEPFKFLPFADLVFERVLGQWLPKPPTYDWVHPQNQLNDIREMRRVHRRRALPKFLRKEGAFTDEEEFNKLCEDDEGGTARVNGSPADAVLPLPYPPLDPAIFRDEQTTLEDFTRTSGISGESQQVAQSETATQANLIALMGQTRENAKRMQVAQWLSAVGRLILLTIKENMALPIWIKKAVDPYSPLAAVEAQDVAHLWQQITKEELGDIDNEISIDLASISPVQQEQERANWLQFLGILTNPAVGLVLSQSPSLIRKTAQLFNINSERDLMDVSNAMTMAANFLAQAQMAKSGGGMGPAGPPAPGPTPSNPAIAGQLAEQLPVEVRQG